MCQYQRISPILRQIVRSPKLKSGLIDEDFVNTLYKVKLTTEELHDRDEKIGADITEITITQRDGTEYPGDQENHYTSRKHNTRYLC